jgi:hypothetical protein
MEALQLPMFLSDEREPVMRIVSIRVSDAVIDPGSAPHTQGLDAICSLLPRIMSP